MSITLIYFREVRTCSSWIKLAYSLILGCSTAGLCATNVEIDKEDPHGSVLLAILATSFEFCQDHGGIVFTHVILLLCLICIV